MNALTKSAHTKQKQQSVSPAAAAGATKTKANAAVPAADADDAADEQDDGKTDQKQHKLVFVVRMDLRMRVGKIASQCAHAAIGIYAELSQNNPSALTQWLGQGQAKVVLKCANLEQLTKLENEAKALSLPTHVVHDAGRTQVAAGSATVLAIGPAPSEVVNQVTGRLSLL